MSVTDILAAITASTDGKIADARQTHKAHLSDMRTALEAELETMQAEVQELKEQKKSANVHKTTAHAEAMIKSAELNAKQAEIDALYKAATEALAKLSEKELEPLFSHWLTSLPAGGTILPSAKHEALLKKIGKDFTVGTPTKAVGGFVYQMDTAEVDYTFEGVVRNSLRPQTEVEVSHLLFS